MSKKPGRPKGSQNKPKQLNVGGLPNSPQIQKIFSEALQQKNIGIDKIILNINGGNSELVTNKNSILKYSLKQPINLEVGDTITCIGSYVEEKGLQQNTVSFEEDVEAEMRFLYYKQGDTGDQLSSCTDVGFVAYPKIYPDSFYGTSNNRGDLVNTYLQSPALYENLVGDIGLNMNFGGVGYGIDASSVTTDFENLTSGCNGNYYYLMESVKYKKELPPTYREFGGDKGYFMRPVYGSKLIKVKAGNYSVDSLANIISAQLNGSLGQNNNEFSDALLDKLYNTNGVNKNNFFATYPYFKDLDDVPEPTQESLIGNCGETAGYERRVDGFVKQINYSNFSYYENWAFQNIWLDTSVDPKDRLPTNILFPNGTNVFEGTKGIKFDGNGSLPNFDNLMTSDLNYGNGKKHSHFYMNGKALNTFFETEGKWYNLDGLPNNKSNIDNLFFPPSLNDICYCTIDLFNGYIPRFTTNASTPGYSNQFPRFNNVRSAISYQMLFPVKDLRYPGEENTEPLRQVFAGTSIAQLTFGDSVSNRFALSNFHEFYKLPNLTPDGKSTTGYGGQQATKFNNPYYNDDAQSSVSDNVAVAKDTNISPVYPVDSSSGVAINNFDFGLVKDTVIYKNLISEIQAIDGDTAELQVIFYKEKLIYDLFTKPFESFFSSPAEAESQWSKSLWSRLGFTYNQLGDVSSNLESYEGSGSTFRNTPIKQKGIITHNSFDYSMIVSSDGLGSGNPNVNSGTPMQNYRLESYFNGQALPNSLGLSGNNIHLLVNSKPINASELPSLNNGKSYLLIESDIIKPNFKDNKANWGNLLAVMSKENASNDTIFGAEPIDFTVTEPRLLSEITIYIKNPDGSLAADDVVGQNNGFIIQIAKGIPVQKLPSIS
jgi:hypothetical protein